VLPRQPTSGATPVAERGRAVGTRRLKARERILETAYDLFSRNGTQAVGIDAIVRQANVALQTPYRHFPQSWRLS
jgi:AcrR family transcriptional regulator